MILSIFTNDNQGEPRLRINLNMRNTIADYEYTKYRTRPIKATKQNIKYLREWIYFNACDYNYGQPCSTKVSYKLKIKKGKVSVIETKRLDC